jgi:mRNA interferase MazF
LITSSLIDAPLLRIEVVPSPENGLGETSQIMIDKTMTVSRAKIGKCFGRLSADDLIQVERCLAVFLGIAK